MNSNLGKQVFVGMFWGISISIAFVVGFIFEEVFTQTSHTASSHEYGLLLEVQTLLDENYLREQPSPTERQYAAIRGMLSSLDDRYTFFIDPPVAQSESDVLAGTYGGIGVQIQRNEMGDVVMYPFEDGPAKKAGIQDGDILLKINDEDVTLSVRQDTIDQMLRGEVKNDNGVTLEYRRGEEILSDFVLFDVINVPSVIWRTVHTDDSIGYIQVLRFTSRTPDEFAEAIEALSMFELLGVVIDLRDNSGGLLQESVQTASIVLDGGVVVYEVNHTGERVFEATEGDLLNGLPIVVLVNQGTASAAELVAGAIRDSGRGIIVGQQTFGKGTVQQIYRLSDESSLHVTSAEWFTPERNALDGIGLIPDIMMIPDENGRDVELGEAIRHLIAASNESET